MRSRPTKKPFNTEGLFIANINIKPLINFRKMQKAAQLPERLFLAISKND
jgi:hypothetical protein